ncbi:MAG TPA: HAMP domain-containing sensor histidine kinase, partial [Gemmatimonadales bacterium]|nr:HAMP domain-containing sensor histidine kinase [Gemmatimonadales bacterium]
MTPQPVKAQLSRSTPDAHSQRTGPVGLPPQIQVVATQQLISMWPADLGPVPSPTEVAKVMAILVGATLEMQITDSAVIDERAHSPLGRSLLAALRAELLRSWRDVGVSDAELAPLLAALERVRAAIAPDASQSLTAQLAGTDGHRLLIDVAHDLRSPLTSILFLAETMQRGQSGPVTDVQRRQLGLIYTAALGLSSVASDIIDLTRSELLVEQKPVPFSVSGVLEAVHDIVRPIAEEKQLAVRLTQPAIDERLGHPVALSRVLLNLTTNALKFTSQGSVEIRAEDVGPERVEFSVVDTGKGIDTSIMPTLFDPVRRARRSGEHEEYVAKLFSQTGLGLTICRKLVATMGSELEVESRVGWGTRFHFTLELASPTYRTARRTGGTER